MTDHERPDAGETPEPFDPEPFDPYEGLDDLTGSEPLPPLEEPTVPIATPPRSPLLTGLIVLLLLVVLSIAAFQLLSDDEPGTAVPTTSATTTTSDGATTVTTEQTTTTTIEGTGGTPAPPGNSTPYEPVGDAIPTADLTLAVDSIGPIELGTDARDSVGRLVATFGAPEEDTGPITSTGAFGGCEGDTVRVLRFGALRAVVIIDPDGDEIFGGYRLDLAFGGLSHESSNLKTLSGLGVGNSVRQLEQIYSSFDVKFLTEAELGDIFELRNSSGSLLLWGPVSSPDDEGFVRGIYSPDACGRF